MVSNTSSTQIWLTKGVKQMLLATLCFTIMQLFIKEVANLHTFQITFFRASVTSFLCFGYSWYFALPILGNKHGILLLRALLGIISMTSFFFTLQWMPFGASVTLKYLSPIFATIAAIAIVGEKVKGIQWLFFAMALAGVLLLKGFDSRIDNWSLGIGLLGAMAGGIIYPLIRKIGNSEHPIVIINYYMFSASLIMALLMLPFWQHPSPIEWIYLLIIGSSGFVGQVFMTKAFQLESVSRIAPMKYLEVVYALLIGLIWYGETYVFFSFLGIVLIMGGMFLNLKYKSR